jgi:hypothetical protein
LVLSSIGRGEEAVNPRTLHGTGVKWRVDCRFNKEVEEEVEEEVGEEVEEEALLPS